MAASPLGEFLRARRDSARPEGFGLPVGSRRRAPGLRRTELAALAGISVEYLVRIEQGRDRRPSAPVVNALAGALRLDHPDREHLRHLAKITEGSECVGRPPQAPPEVAAGVRRTLDLIEPGLAMVIDRLGEVLACTASFAAFAGPSGLLDGEANLTRFALADPRAREVFPDRDRVVDEQVAELWQGPSEERTARWRAELPPDADAELERRLARHPRRADGVLRWRHPSGVLRLERQFLELPQDLGQQLVVLLPADDASEELLWIALRGRPLRAVR
ncbi:helix-turn-helix domain-containing protein [Pseudonocardia parietis]|uniref:Transcriptional regulator with XRE-family HTH domain n=1 Tax=Pseudonocardia parietis TaxID=570936 RepID=A0ABS4VQ30_9PSEU|nr:helix-turn-helix transcriptional regulator [Pseudonocardia parietis]MBP2365679.1 transcriptional regulator with XRE-family HTH domain [Pseudonocardia parietis]